MDKKEVAFKGLIFAGLLVILSTLVLAVHTATISSGATSLNHDEDLFRIYNISINNTDFGAAANITDLNITLPSTFLFVTSSNGTSGGVAGVHTFLNSTTVLTWRNGAFLVNATVNLSELKTFWFNATASTPGIYNITVQAKNATYLSNTNFTVRINDTTVPNIESSNFTMVGYNNNSGVIVLNISVGDNSIINTVFFNLTNSSGDVVREDATSPASGGIYWNGTISTASYADGKYNLSVYANDTYGDLGNYTTFLAGNINNSARIQITIDNTDPSGTVSCSPSSVQKDATVTCTCSGSDALSGVNSTSITANPTTAQTGTFTASCSITDLAGNVGSVDGTYTVTGSGGGSGGAGGGSGLSPSTTWTATFTVTDADFSSGTTRDVAEKKRLQVNVDGESHYVGVIDVTPTNAKISVSSTPQEVTMNVGETRKFEITDDNFYDMEVTLVSVSGSTASIRVQSIHEEMPESETTTTTTGTSGTGAGATGSGLSKGMIIGIVIAIIIIGVIVFFVMRNRK